MAVIGEYANFVKLKKTKKNQSLSGALLKTHEG